MSKEEDDFIEPGKGIQYHVNKWMRENPKEYNNAFGQGLAYVKNRGMIQTEAGKKAFESALERWNNGNKIKLKKMNDKEEIVRKNYPDHDREESKDSYYERMYRSKMVADSLSAYKRADKLIDERYLRCEHPSDEEIEHRNNLYKVYIDLRDNLYKDYIPSNRMMYEMGRRTKEMSDSWGAYKFAKKEAAESAKLRREPMTDGECRELDKLHLKHKELSEAYYRDYPIPAPTPILPILSHEEIQKFIEEMKNAPFIWADRDTPSLMEDWDEDSIKKKVREIDLELAKLLKQVTRDPNDYTPANKVKCPIWEKHNELTGLKSSYNELLVDMMDSKKKWKELQEYVSFINKRWGQFIVGEKPEFCERQDGLYQEERINNK